MDEDWWRVYAQEVHSDFLGYKASVCGNSGRYHVHRVMQGRAPMQTYGNSGAGAVAMAALYGARRAILLGYDCAKTGGKTHWHGDHPRGLGNAGSMGNWQHQFKRLAEGMKGIEIINCSRETALGMFPRAALEDVL